MDSSDADPPPGRRIAILHLEDDSADALLLKAHLKRDRLDCDIRWVQTKKDFIEALSQERFDVVLSDYRMPEFNGDQALKFVSEQHPDLPFIMVTGELGEDRAIETLKRGATDYVLKGNLARLAPAIQRALREARAAAERRQAIAELAAVRENLAQELEDMRRLHELSARLLRGGDLQTVLHQVLEACTQLLGANRGNIQLLDEETNALRIVTHVGFDQEFLDTFQRVPLGRDCVCAKALERGERIVVEDVFADDRFPEVRGPFARLGLVAVASTPLFCRERRVFGMISSHFDRPHRPSERQLQLLDLYVQQAERVIELREVGSQYS